MRHVAAICIAVFVIATMRSSGAVAAIPGKGFTETGCEQYSDSVARLYTAGLGREPEQDGFEFWMTEYTTGRWSLPTMSTFFTQSSEFAASYGALTQDGFIRQLYRNVLGREGEGGGITFWNDQMNLGMDRGTVLLRFAESPENITNSGTDEPELGPFNAGLPGPWACHGWAPPSGQTPADSLPIGRRFQASGRFSDATFDGQILGLVEGQRRDFASEGGRCFFVVGTLTPTQLDAGNASRSFDTPDVSLIAGGQRINRTSSLCVWDEIQAAGWRWSLSMSTTVGTAYPFFEEIFMPAGGPQTPTSIIIGNPATNDALYFDASVSDGIPSAPVPPSGPNTFLNSGSALGTTFDFRQAFGAVTWNGKITSVVQGTPSRDNGGSCVFILGVLTPTVIDEGVVTRSFDAPFVSLLNRGRIIDAAGGGCDWTEFEAAGWGWILLAEVTVDTPYPFFTAIHVKDGNTLDPQAVIVGPPASAEAIFYNIPSVSPTVPAAP